MSLTFDGSNRNCFSQPHASSAESVDKKRKTFQPPNRSYLYKPILDISTRMECLIATKSLDQIEATGEFPDIKSIVDKVKVLKFDELQDGRFELPDHFSCKLDFLKEANIVVIKAPSKIVFENQQIRKVRPLERLHGSQRKLRPLIGVTECGKILDLIQLSSNTLGSERMLTEKIKDRIDFEEIIYTNFPKDHDKTPLPVTLCLLREKENGSPTQIRKLKLIQKRESMDLMEFLKNNRDLSFADALKMAQEIITGLYLCHNRMKIVVADLKLDNILINLDDKKVRLTDFGLSYFAEGANIATQMVGTPFLIPPEIFQDCLDCRQLKNIKCGTPIQNFKKLFARDIWSMGYILSLLLFRTYPKCIYDIDQNASDSAIFGNFFRKIINGIPDETEIPLFFKKFNLPPFSERQLKGIQSIDDSYKETRIKALKLIIQMFDLDPLKRPTAEELMKQFQSFDL